MRKIIAVVILIGLGILLYFSPSIYNRKATDTIDQLADGNIQEDEILPLAKASDGDALDFSVEQLQQSPVQIVTFNAMVMKVMYKSGDNVKVLTEEEIELLVKVQRMYYHEELLAMNDLELHVLGVVKEVERAREGKSWIVDYRVEAPVYDVNNSNIAVVNVTFIPNSLGESTDINQQYVVERVDGLWFIKGWRGISTTDTVNVE